MIDDITFVKLWWWICNNIFVGSLSAIVTAIFLIIAVYSFIRWKMFGLSLIMLSIALVTAYAGGFIMILRGTVS